VGGFVGGERGNLATENHLKGKGAKVILEGEDSSQGHLMKENRQYPSNALLTGPRAMEKKKGNALSASGGRRREKT